MALKNAEARERTSRKFEYHRTPATIGHYLLSLVLEEKGDKATVTTERNKALEKNPQVARLSIREAQLDIARAHQ